LPSNNGDLRLQGRRLSTQVEDLHMLSLSQNTVVIALLVGAFIMLLLIVRVLVANRRLLTLVEEQALAMQKLSAEVFEMQNVSSEATRNMSGTTQGLARIERELQALSALVSSLKASTSIGAGDGLQQLGKEIKKTLQSREVTEFLDSARNS